MFFGPCLVGVAVFLCCGEAFVALSWRFVSVASVMCQLVPPGYKCNWLSSVPSVQHLRLLASADALLVHIWDGLLGLHLDLSCFFLFALPA